MAPTRTAILLLALLAACAGPGDAAEDRLLVLAATSLNVAAPILADQFEAATGTPVDFVLASTGNLAAQIQNGAPADVFLSADTETVERLVRGGHLRAESVRGYANGELVMVWRDGIEPPDSIGSLRREEYAAIALASPEHAPYGAAARDALQNAGIWEEIEPKRVYGESVAQALQLVLTGNADVALVARSVVVETRREATPVDPALYTPIGHAAGVLTTSTHPAAGDFLDFLLSPPGREILLETGFGIRHGNNVDRSDTDVSR